MDEIWIFPVMLKIALIRYIRFVAERMITSQYQKFKVASLVERIIKNKSTSEQAFSQYRNINLNGEISSYVEFLVYLLKKEGKSAKKYLDVLNEEAKQTLGIYKRFYSKVALRNKELSRVNVFTTNNDMFNELALDSLSIHYFNGFSGGVKRFFNPASLNYTLSKRMDTSIDKY